MKRTVCLMVLALFTACCGKSVDPQPVDECAEFEADGPTWCACVGGEPRPSCPAELECREIERGFCALPAGEP